MKKKISKRKSNIASAAKIVTEVTKHDGPFSHEIAASDSKGKKAALEQSSAASSLPPEIFQHLILTGAGKSNRTPGQLLKNILVTENEGEAPKEIQNWYTQIYGEFAKGTLSEVMQHVLMFAAYKDDSIIQNIRTAILKGDVKYLEHIARCVAVVHGIRHENNSARLFNATRRNIGLAYLRLYEMDGKPPTAREIHVMLGRNACLKSNPNRIPKFSSIWYLLRSGPTDDSLDKPTREARYEVTGLRNIKRIVRSFGWPLGRSVDGPLTVMVMRQILDLRKLRFVDDSTTLTC